MEYDTPNSFKCQFFLIRLESFPNIECNIRNYFQGLPLDIRLNSIAQ